MDKSSRKCLKGRVIYCHTCFKLLKRLENKKTPKDAVGYVFFFFRSGVVKEEVGRRELTLKEKITQHDQNTYQYVFKEIVYHVPLSAMKHCHASLIGSKSSGVHDEKGKTASHSEKGHDDY